MKLSFGKVDIKNKVLGVAVSGGSDSMALLNSLFNLSKSENFNIVAINVEHGIRGESSIKDSEFVKNYCENNGITFYGFTVNAKKTAEEKGISVETAARILRYDCFNKAIEKGFCDFVATAHHREDNIESILLNIFRGSGVSGLKGMCINNGNIIRPMLSVSKAEIIEYITENKVPFVTDETNYVTDYTRNYIRLKVIPEIKNAFPSFENAVLRLSSSATEDEEFIENIAQSFVDKNGDNSSVKIPCPIPVFARAVIKALSLIGVFVDYEKTHISALFSLSVGENGKRVNLPHGVIAFKEYDKITFTKNSEVSNFTYPFATGNFDFSSGTLNIFNVNNFKKDGGYYADFDKFSQNAIIRTRKNGDVFKKFGGGTKNLNDVFTDYKVPVRLRDNIPIIADGNKVLFISGIGISDLVKVDNATKNLIKLCYKAKED